MVIIKIKITEIIPIVVSLKYPKEFIRILKFISIKLMNPIPKPS
jgi:hypothetical protein